MEKKSLESNLGRLQEQDGNNIMYHSQIIHGIDVQFLFGMVMVMATHLV